MSQITFEVLKIIVSICAAGIAVYLLPYLKTLREDKKYDKIVEMIEVAVRAAEQTMKDDAGALKKSEVLASVSKWMSAAGIEISPSQLDQLIECAVYQMKQEGE